jgi:peptidoglycan/xylan/chitin deacetylase (PgdA/CDA1 family)
MSADGRDADAQGMKLAAPREPANLTSRLKALAARVIPDRVLVKSGPPGPRRVALTFDDGPHAMTDTYLDLLDRYHVRATFFLVGAECARYPDAVLRIVARGHEVAGHGYTHTAFPNLRVAELRDELARTAALLPPAPTARPLVRPPFGATSIRSLAVSAQAGYTSVLWSRDSDDCRTTSTDDIVARLAPEALTPGEIVLLHEGQEWTLAALPRALEALAASGWQTVTVGDMIDDPGKRPAIER